MAAPQYRKPEQLVSNTVMKKKESNSVNLSNLTQSKQVLKDMSILDHEKMQLLTGDAVRRESSTSVRWPN